MIAISRFAVQHALAILSSELGFTEETLSVDDLTQDCSLISSTRIFAHQMGENLIRVAVEWMLVRATDAEIDLVSVVLDAEDLRPVLERAYRLLWGPLPGGEAPRVALFRMDTAQETLGACWADCRQRLYGNVEHDFRHLRELAIRPNLVDGQGNPISKIPCEGARLFQ